MAHQQDNSTDAEYDRDLRRLMHDCLPGILVDIVEQRPCDPIFHLAQCLYRSQGKELPAHYKNQHGGAAPPKPSTQVNKGTDNSQTVNGARLMGVDEMTVMQEEDPIDFIEDIEAAEMTNTVVHEQMSSVFITIGDIFNDEDIS